ncbi:MAG: thiolase C-terminal domain-containing protein, partial [Candidatus Promineifilaceae bacterium]
GLAETALAVGVEKASDQSGNAALSAVAAGLDADYELVQGQTPAGAAALLMRRYQHEHGVELADFAGFSVNAHANAAGNPRAMYRNRLRAEQFAASPPVAEPVSLFDMAPLGDGAAAVVVTRSERAGDLVPQPIRIAGSAVATDRLALHDRRQLLRLDAAERSARQALAEAGLTPAEVDFFELHDSYTILAALALEAAGFAAPGEGVRLAQAGAIGRDGRIPISTFGGLKARGNPVGATGVYQIVEAVLQLRGQAGDCQVADARVGLTQNLGGSGATAVTHVLRRDE